MRKLFRFKRLRRGGRSRVGNAALFVVMIALSVLMIAPLVYSVINSFKPLDELFAYPPRFFVVRPTMENYSMLFKLVANMRVPFSRYLFNSAFITALTTVASVVIASMAAYPLAKFQLRVKWIFNFVVVALLFNTTILWLPQYVILAKTGMLDTYLVYILPQLATPLGLFLMKQFISVLPDSMIEAVKVDGAGTFRTYWSIVMPNVKPAWMTCIIFAFQSIWNYEGTQFIYDESLKVLPTMFRQISEGGISRVGVGAAAAVLLMIPPILIFTFSQSQVIETMAQSGLKE